MNLAHKKIKLVKRIKKLSYRYGGGHNYVAAARERVEKLQKEFQPRGFWRIFLKILHSIESSESALGGMSWIHRVSFGNKQKTDKKQKGRK